MTAKYTASTPGTLLINLDNKQSYMRSKSVSWRLGFDWDAAAAAKVKVAEDAAAAKKPTPPKMAKVKKTTML